MGKKQIIVNLSEEAHNRLDSLTIAYNCSSDAIVEHLLMGRMSVENGVGVVSELSRLRPIVDAAKAWATSRRLDVDPMPSDAARRRYETAEAMLAALVSGGELTPEVSAREVKSPVKVDEGAGDADCG